MLIIGRTEIIWSSFRDNARSLRLVLAGGTFSSFRYPGYNGRFVGRQHDRLWPDHEKGEKSIEHFWEFAAFVVNSVIFIILGINLASQDFAKASIPIVVAIIAVIIGRAVAVYPCSALFAGSSFKVDTKLQHVLFWGGLRGAFALALALGIPDTLPYRQEILTVTFGVVAFSVFVQGLTITPLLRRLGQIPDK